MRILKAINRVPGGLMVVPLFVGMVVNTFAPHLLKIGGFTQALSGAGYPTVLGMYLFTVGTKMTLAGTPRMLKRGCGILVVLAGTSTSWRVCAWPARAVTRWCARARRAQRECGLAHRGDTAEPAERDH